jgi:hypothetical protein
MIELIENDLERSICSDSDANLDGNWRDRWHLGDEAYLLAREFGNSSSKCLAVP